LARFFRAIVTAEDVNRGKPDPDVFLLAAERIGQAPGQCVVLEDAHVGIQAARAAGTKVIGVATTHPAHTLAADFVAPDLRGVSLDAMRRLWS
jgi:beta-phosphoglucomutase-like phosphatase (HAD superfamily)